MKNLISSFLILLASTNIFGQTGQNNFSHSKAIVDGFYLDIEYDIRNTNTYFYGFINNDTVYALSYRSNDEENWENPKPENNWRVGRDILLYRKDINGWVEASNVVQTDYTVATVDHDYGTHKSYSRHNWSILRYITEDGLGTVMKLKNGCVFMMLSNLYASTEIDDWEQFYFCSVVILVPNGDGTYTATHFEPLNKATKTPELSGTSCKEITTKNDNEINVEIYNGTNKKGTLNFTVANGNVYYSGDFKLAQTK